MKKITSVDNINNDERQISKDRIKTSHSDRDITKMSNNNYRPIFRNMLFPTPSFGLNALLEPLHNLPLQVSRNSINDDITSNELNYSIYADDKIRLSSSPDLNLKKIIPKINDKWVESKMIYNCQKCNDAFGFLLRKHHCRSCGGVFCYKCCDKYIIIPENLIKRPIEDNSYKAVITNSYRWLFNKDKELVCTDCHQKILTLKDITPLIQIFYYLDVITLCKITSVNRNYYIAAQHYLIKFRDIQYKNLLDKFDYWEERMIYEIKDYLIFHNIWFVILIKSIYSYTLKTKKTDRLEWLNLLLDDIVNLTDANLKNKYKLINCWFVLCSRRCIKKLDFDDIINILNYLSTVIITDDVFWSTTFNKQIILKLSILLMRRSVRKNYIFIPILCKIYIELFNNEYINLDEGYIEQLFNILFFNTKIKPVNLVINDYILKLISLLIYENYFISSINVIYTNEDIGSYCFKRSISKYINDTFGQTIISDFDEMVNNIKKIIDNPINPTLTLPFIYPFNAYYKIVKIIKISVLSSYTKPILVEAEINNKESKTNKKIKFIIKNDKSLRKEQIISCLIDTLQYKLTVYKYQNELNNFEHIPTYQIIMLTSTIGLIEFIEDSITLRNVNTLGFTLQNYILDKNPHSTLDIIKRRFLQSLAISSCISYIIGLGDRHLDNIMINNSGQLFHIDYGYIMENPLSTSLLDVPEIKVTNEIIDFLGGVNSLYYNEFKTLFVKIYNIFRSNKNILYIYFQFICDEGFLNWKIVEKKLESKMMNGMKCKDIEITLINEIESANSITNMFVDMCYNYKQKIFTS